MKEHNRKVLTSSKNQTWETPQKLFQRLHDLLDFTVDAAAEAGNAKLPDFWDETKDGLSEDWEGHRVFCNPPYNDTASWVKKAHDEWIQSETTEAVLLLPSRTDTAYWHNWILPFPGTLVLFLRGRLKFEQQGKTLDAAVFPSALVFFLQSAEAKGRVQDKLSDLGFFR